MPELPSNNYSIGNITQGCADSGGIITLTQVSTGPNTTLSLLLLGTNGQVGAYSFSKNTTNGSITFDKLVNDNYVLEIQPVTGGETETIREQGVAIECAVTPPVCDLIIESVDVTDSMTTVASGTATINVSASNLVSFQVDDEPWDPSNFFHALAPGLHVARARYIENPACFDEFEFEIKAPNVVGCTNEEADNYNRDATEDDGSCVFTPQVYATGGTLPNPVYVPVSLPTSVGGILKTNHYVDLKIYKVGETQPFAALRQTLIDGKAHINIATYLRNRMQNELQDSSLMILGNPNNSLQYYVGIVEHYGGHARPEQLRMEPPRFAVNAALQDYPGDISPYVISPDDVLKDFMYAISEPILVEGYNQSVSLFIRPDAPQPLYFQRRYMDARRQNVEIRSTLIPAYLYGTRVDFNLYDLAILCAEYLEVTIQTEQVLLTGICPPELTEDGQIFDFSFDWTFE